MAQGTFIWNEMLTRDVEKAKAFYAALIGWTFRAVPGKSGTYWVAELDGRTGRASWQCQQEYRTAFRLIGSNIFRSRMLTRP